MYKDDIELWLNAGIYFPKKHVWVSIGEATWIFVVTVSRVYFKGFLVGFIDKPN